MTSCPSCQQPVDVLEQHKGTLFTCPHCNAVFFIDWDGQPEAADHEISTPPYEIPENDFANAGQDFAGVPDFNQPLSHDVNHDADVIPGLDGDAEAFSPADEVISDNGTFVGAPEVDFELPIVEAPLGSADEYLPPQDQDEAPFEMETPRVVTPDNSDFSDVTDFGNAETDLSTLTYSIMIEGLETSQLVHQFKEAITDLRFRWDVNAIMKSIRGGRVVIKSLGPAKASVLVSRLKYMPVKLSWRQDVHSSI